eukprot:CAMPEP_0194213276 /NCGR_PEP_ID=MMETSP0156-20130528/13702_1 /TAXON_ID=33649 /ORGANISM="Thalassionema nitzschioides, Strain L26-B" /LENGTH=299 /DNA_ID=CAMNT_0038941267 /DNA_START=271 /DNA_END=1170 /DNA_ORIENTATION=-
MDEHIGFEEVGEVTLADASIALICETGEDGNGRELSKNKPSEADSEEEIPISFPQKLMDILNGGEHSDVIAWLPHGKGFIISKKKKFAAKVLPKYFKQSKYSSFTRKLNRWGFVRVNRGPELGAYYHKFFQRGNLRLCFQMSCRSSSSKPRVVLPTPATGHSFGRSSMGNVLPLSNTPSEGFAEQSQSMICQQLYQLQLQHIELQQLQMQQQFQASELSRQAFAETSEAVCSEQTYSNTSSFQSLEKNNESDSYMAGIPSFAGVSSLSLCPILQNDGAFARLGDSFLGGNVNGRGAWAA